MDWTTMAAIPDALAGLAEALGLQTEMPSTKEPPKPGMFESPETLRILLWTAVAFGIAALVWYLVDILPRGVARRARWDGAGEAPPASTAAHEAARDDADDLAGQGRFVEAMHVLLLRGLADMRQRLEAGLPDSLTSREILRRAPVPASARAALADIIDAVERSYFGEQPVGQADYTHCRSRFTALIDALRAAPQPASVS